MGDLADQAVATLLISLRIVPTLAFAAPFTLLRVPSVVRVMLAIALAAWLVAGNPQATWQSPGFAGAGLPALAIGELVLGIALALALQLAFAAILTVGRVADVQAGFGLAMLVDPATRNQMPLIGTLFAYAAASMFFAIGGPRDLLAIWAASVAQVPLGSAEAAGDPGLVADYLGTVFLMAAGLAGVVLLVLFLVDLAVAFLSRTLPQMNVLVFGFQAKAIATIAVLPLSLALSGALFARMMRFAIETMPRLV